jgi:hypothetical protein
MPLTAVGNSELVALLNDRANKGVLIERTGDVTGLSDVERFDDFLICDIHPIPYNGYGITKPRPEVEE